MAVSWDTIPREELKPFLEKNSAVAWRILAFNWALIILSFALVMIQPAWYTVLPAMIILGGRQLGLGILAHECAHRSLMKSPATGEWVGRWLCGAPVFVDLELFRMNHMIHHVKTGTLDDPDLANYSAYPVTAASLRRKFIRDLTGSSGRKTLISLFLLYGRVSSGNTGRNGGVQNPASLKTTTTEMDIRPRDFSWRTLIRNFHRILLVNLLMLGMCCALHHPASYLIWPASWLTTYMLFSRIRNAAEHGALPGTRSSDMWQNTRSVRAAWWERLTVAPNFVNYHFEHHLAPTVPAYNLPKLHRWLVQQGAFERATLESGYYQVVQRMIGKDKQNQTGPTRSAP